MKPKIIIEVKCPDDGFIIKHKFRIKSRKINPKDGSEAKKVKMKYLSITYIDIGTKFFTKGKQNMKIKTVEVIG